MAKDGTLRGGARAGSGPKNKPLTEKISAGKKAMVLDLPEPADLDGVYMPPVKEYMKAQQRDGSTLYADEVLRETWEYLNRMGCAEIVNPQLLYSYSMCAARWIQAEECISKFGLLAKHPTTQQPTTSPYAKISESYSKQMMVIWNEIFQIVKENSSVEYTGGAPHDDVMERLLRSRKGD